MFSRFSSALFLFLSWGRHLVFEGTNGQTRTTSNVTSINLPAARIRSNLRDSHDLVSTKITIATSSWLRITKADWISKGNTEIIENRIYKILWKSDTLRRLIKIIIISHSFRSNTDYTVKRVIARIPQWTRNNLLFLRVPFFFDTLLPFYISNTSDKSLRREISNYTRTLFNYKILKKLSLMQSVTMRFR